MIATTSLSNGNDNRVFQEPERPVEPTQSYDVQVLNSKLDRIMSLMATNADLQQRRTELVDSKLDRVQKQLDDMSNEIRQLRDTTESNRQYITKVEEQTNVIRNDLVAVKERPALEASTPETTPDKREETVVVEPMRIEHFPVETYSTIVQPVSYSLPTYSTTSFQSYSTFPSYSTQPTYFNAASVGGVRTRQYVPFQPLRNIARFFGAAPYTRRGIISTGGGFRVGG